MEAASRALRGDVCNAIGEVERTLRNMVAKAFVSMGPPRRSTGSWNAAEWWRGYLSDTMIDIWNEKKRRHEQDGASRGDLWVYASFEDLPKIMSFHARDLSQQVFPSMRRKIHNVISTVDALTPFRQVFAHQTTPPSVADARQTIGLVKMLIDLVPVEYHDSADLSAHVAKIWEDVLKQEQANVHVREKRIEQPQVASAVSNTLVEQGFDATLDRLELESKSRSAMQEHEDIVEHLIRSDEHYSIRRIRTAVAAARIRAINSERESGWLGGWLSGESCQHLLASAKRDMDLLEAKLSALREQRPSVDGGDESDGLYGLFRRGLLSAEEYDELESAIKAPDEYARVLNGIIEAIESELSLARSVTTPSGTT